MNLIEEREQMRLSRIRKIQNSIKESKDPDFKKLIMLCCAEWGVSDRTAKEYVKIAQFNISNETNKNENSGLEKF